MKDVAGAKIFVKSNPNDSPDPFKGYKSLKLANADEIAKAVGSAGSSAAKDLKLALVDADKKIANGQPLKFTFTPANTEVGATTNFGTYTLYRQTAKAVGTAKDWEWEQVAQVKLGGTGDAELKRLKTTVDTSKTPNTTTYSGVKAEEGDFTIRSLDAYIKTTAGVAEFDYAKTSTYKLVREVDGVLVYSKELTVEANTVKLTADKYAKSAEIVAVPANTDVATPISITAADKPGTITVKTTAYLKTVTVKSVTNGEKTPATSGKRIVKGKVTNPKVGDDGKSFEVTIAGDVTACYGDKITVTATDVRGASGDVEIELKSDLFNN